jgi:ubiquitin-protein ligase
MPLLLRSRLEELNRVCLFTQTPYEGGFFYFVMKCPDDYPHNPPKVRLMTTGGGTVRFNPNLYKEGRS